MIFHLYNPHVQSVHSKAKDKLYTLSVARQPRSFELEDGVQMTETWSFWLPWAVRRGVLLSARRCASGYRLIDNSRDGPQGKHHVFRLRCPSM